MKFSLKPLLRKGGILYPVEKEVQIITNHIAYEIIQSVRNNKITYSRSDNR